jgi:TetR/AcrR family transcriptional repressor of nem operon
MARPRQFDEQEVRERIADVFTTNGFRGTSLAMLTDAAGVGKQGLYNAFGDKQALYLQALDDVSDRFAGLAQVMAASPTGRAAIETFFARHAALCTDRDPAVNNCIVSAGLLEGLDEPLVTHKLCQKWGATHLLLTQAVQRGQRDGTVRSDIPADDWARLLMTLTSGLRVTARALRDESALITTLRLGLKPLWTDP